MKKLRKKRLVLSFMDEIKQIGTYLNPDNVIDLSSFAFDDRFDEILYTLFFLIRFMLIMLMDSGKEVRTNQSKGL